MMGTADDFTPEEQALIDRWLDFYHDLDEGRRRPRTEQLIHFRSVCRGDTEAETSYEIAYMKWKRREYHRAKNNKDNNRSLYGIPYHEEG
jgi:uncharacterized protein YifE (UPF0438 family)